MTERTVVNIDGVVNEAAAESIRKRELGEYLFNEGINYVVDYPVFWTNRTFGHTFGGFLGDRFRRALTEETARFDLPGIVGPYGSPYVSLSKIIWR